MEKNNSDEAAKDDIQQLDSGVFPTSYIDKEDLLTNARETLENDYSNYDNMQSVFDEIPWTALLPNCMWPFN